jgi:hypothetical protein
MKTKKSKVLWSGMLAMALAFGFVAVGCATSTDSGDGEITKFEGTWEQQKGEVTHVYTFTKNKMRYTGGNTRRPGMFTFTDTDITFIPAEANTWQGWKQGYTLEGDTLTLADDGQSGNHPSGAFQKQ